jgi:hypothetical protein
VALPIDYSAGFDLLTQEYRAALHALYSEDEPWGVRQRRVRQLTAEHRRRCTQEMKAIRAQRNVKV